MPERPMPPIVPARRSSAPPRHERRGRPKPRNVVSAEITIEGGGARLEPHPLRAAVLGELHARPFTPIETPRRALHFAFDTSAERGEADRAALVDFCARRALLAPKPSDKHHLVAFGGTALRWEQHSEFTTYTWELPAEGGTPGAAPFHPSASALA